MQEPSKKQLKKQQKLELKQQRKLNSTNAADTVTDGVGNNSTAIDVSIGFYGKSNINQSKDKTSKKFAKFKELRESEKITLIARVMNVRPQGSKMVFLTLRQHGITCQGILIKNAAVSKEMLKFAAGINMESIVELEAVVTKTPEPIKSCDIKDFELKIQKIFIVSESERLPFSIEEASRSAKEIEENNFNPIHLDTRLNNRVIDLRTNANQAIFRVQAAVSKLFREYLDNLDFVEIHSPKLLGAASEGGSNVFKVSYFKTNAYLAQSPQFYKQMAIAADFGRVYEIAPVFRAENSFTHRHMTEFMGLDMEMAFNEHYHEVLQTLCKMFVYIFNGLKKRYSEHLETINVQYPFDDFKYPQETLILDFKQAIALLRENGHTVSDFEDFSTELEKTLGKLVKQKYDTDFFVLDKFPLSLRPFYTMPDPNNPGYSNSYDFFMRGEEILSGAQRIHDPTLLQQRINDLGIDVSTVKEYVDAFKYGTLPHAGGGIGLERVVMLYFGLGNIRKSSLFPRDPRRLAP